MKLWRDRAYILLLDRKDLHAVAFQKEKEKKLQMKIS